MHRDTILGLLTIIVAYGFTVYLILWSRWTIALIARKKFRSLREIMKELRHGP